MAVCYDFLLDLLVKNNELDNVSSTEGSRSEQPAAVGTGGNDLDEGQDEEPLEEGQHQVDEDGQYVGAPRPAPPPFPGSESQPEHAASCEELLAQEDKKH